MRVLLAGGSGVLGRQLVPKLIERGDEVLVIGRDRSRFDAMKLEGAAFARADLLEPTEVRRAVATFRPDAVMHVATAIPQKLNPRKFVSQFELTNRLRDEGTTNIVKAIGSDVRLISQSLAFAYNPSSEARSEDAPLWRDPPAPLAPALEAVVRLEQQTLAAGGIALRLGHLYGPGTALAPDGEATRQIRKRQFPIVGSGGSTFSFVHTADAADAFVAALARDGSGLFNIVDDDPAPMREWLPAYAQALGAKPPRHMPAWLVKLMAGPWGLAYMTQLAGATNRKARRELRWAPEHASWRQGLLTAGPVTSVRGRRQTV